MTLKIQVKGVKEFNKFLGDLSKSSNVELNKLMAISATETHKNAVESINSQSIGKTYTHKFITLKNGNVVPGKKRNKPHTASKEGDAPNSDSGDLTKNITIKKGLTGTHTVGSRKGAPHGFWMEFGTEKVKARPWLQPAFDKMVKGFDSKIKKLFRGKL